MRTKWREDFPTSTNPLRFFIFASRPHWVVVICSVAAVVVSGTIYSAGIPYSFKLITDAVTALGGGGSYQAILWAAGMYIVVTTVSHLIWRISGYTGAYWATGARATARHALTSYVTLHSRA